MLKHRNLDVSPAYLKLLRLKGRNKQKLHLTAPSHAVLLPPEARKGFKEKSIHPIMHFFLISQHVCLFNFFKGVSRQTNVQEHLAILLSPSQKYLQLSFKKPPTRHRDNADKLVSFCICSSRASLIRDEHAMNAAQSIKYRCS